MNIAALSVKRPVTTIMVVLIVILLGVVSFTKIPIDLYPNIEVPIAIVNTSYPNVGPEEIETLVTRPLEEVVGTVSNIDSIQSITREGSSIVIIRFKFGTNMDFAALDVREKVDLVKGFLPDGASEPMVLQIDINAQAIIQMSLSGADIATLQQYAEDVVKPSIERVEGVASVSISGGYQNYVSITLDTEKLNGYGLTIDQLAGILAAENINLPAGTVNNGDNALLLRTVGEFETLEDIQNTLITTPTGGSIRLSDIAQVAISKKAITSVSTVDGVPSVSVAVQKQSGVNTVMVASQVNAAIKELDQVSPYDLKVIIDQSNFINRAINQVANNGLVGGFLAILILFIFLRSFRSTIIIGLSIPISIIATAVILYFSDITLNMMTLGGLALGIGMLVDNSVVVLENIYRLVQEGQNRVDAAINGTKEVAMAITASTLTTVAVFLPMVFVEGITAIMFREFSLTVTFSLMSSLVVSLTLIPALASKLLIVDEFQGQHHHNKFRILSWLLDSTDKVYLGLETGYRRLLKWALGHKKSVVAIALITMILSGLSFFMIGTEFIPAADEGAFTIDVTLDTGAKVEETSLAMDQIVQAIADIPALDYVFTTTEGNGFISSTQNRGTISGVLVPLNQRDVSVFDVIKEVEDRIKDIPGIRTQVTSQSSMGMMTGGSDISIDIKGNDLDILKSLSDQIVEIVKSVSGTRSVRSSMDDPIPQYEIKLRRNDAARYGLTTAQVSNAVKGMLDGRLATRYTLDGTELDVIIEGDARYEESVESLKQLKIAAPTGALVPLGLIADVNMEVGATSISRTNQVRYVTVSSGIYDRDLGDVVADIQAKVNTIELPKGYTVEYGGQNQEMQSAFKDLKLALILAVLLVYMIIASQFESLLVPFIIMLAAPLSFAGGLLGLFFTNRTMNVTSIIGFIMLSGIVVNNAIVLLDYINTRRSFGETREEAILKAGPIRLRPILMTTLTTVLGLIPLALGIGEGAEIQASMATVVIAGLSLSTLLTLIFIPVAYTLFDQAHEFYVSKRKKQIESNSTL